MEEKIKKNIHKNTICINCGKRGHISKECQLPIISYGIILVKVDNIRNFKIRSNKIDINKIYNNTNNIDNIRKFKIRNNKIDVNKIYNNTNNIDNNNIKFLLIRRKHTFEYSEFMMGNYDPYNIEKLSFLISQMTSTEVKRIKEENFDDIWKEYWGDFVKNKEYNKSLEKFKSFKNTNLLDKIMEEKNDIILKNKGEWGFPKGKKTINNNIIEDDIRCAIREFKEETNIKDKYYICYNIDPLVEKFIGTNNLKYKHIYYIAVTDKNIEPSIDKNYNIQMREVGEIGFYNYEESKNLIKDYRKERIEILDKIINYVTYINGG